MKHLLTTEALNVLSSTYDAPHDSLSAFSDELRNLDRLPAFWWQDYPVWIADHPQLAQGHWPLRRSADNAPILPPLADSPGYELPVEALQSHLCSALKAPLTPAELTLTLDLACGLSLEDSATRAALATSTRRKQLQSIFAKFEVSGQAELVSLLGTSLFALRRALDSLNQDSAAAWSAYERFLPESVRRGVIHGTGHAPLRYLDIGPTDGTPAIVLHPMIFPALNEADVAHHHSIGLRTLWPIRKGALSPQGGKADNWHTHTDSFVAQMHSLKRMLTEAPVPLVALVSSGAYATRYAARHGDHVSRIDFVSTCFSAGSTRSRDAYFGDFLTRNLKENSRLALLAIRHLAKGTRRKDNFERTMRRIFADSPPDMALLSEDFASPDRTERLMFAVLSSISSMRHDYLAQVHFSWDDAKALPQPKQFWHGADDRVHSQCDLTSLARHVSAQAPKVLPDMGHLTQGRALHRILEGIAATYPK